MSSGPGDVRPRPAELGYRVPIPYRAVFEFFPSGVVITNGRGEVQGANLAAKRLLGPVFERERLRCCDLLDCRRGGTPLADHCITELALERPSALPEVRVDVAMRGGSVGSVWVTAASVGGAESMVILQLRPGVVGDRRRRTEPHWMLGPQLRMFTLGRTRVESGEGPLAGTWLGHRPGQVLKYLVCHRDRVVSAEELIEVFWPAAGPRGTTSVRQAIHTLRDHLRDLAGQALRGLAENKQGIGDLEGATEQMHRLGELEPLDMDIQRDLLMLLLRRGRHADAHRRYEIVRRRYRRAFGGDPPFDLAELGAAATES